jgi:hypothetical protein
MKFEVELHMFQRGKIRIVDVPDNELGGETDEDLQKIFYYGQNDFQADPQCCSVSAGDIIRFHGARYMINPIGFRKLNNGGGLVSDPQKRILQLYGKDYNK